MAARSDDAGPPSEGLAETMRASAERMAAKLSEAAAPEPSPLGPGAVVRERYEIEAVMAEGGNGVILRARDRELERTVAIKILTPTAARDPSLRARFKLEARHAVKLKSEHVSRVHDVGELDDGTQFIVFELLEGEDLSALLARTGRLDPTHAVDLVLQACEALAEAHHHGIVHRDVKLSNLFLARRADASPTLKVIDFGLAKVRTAAGSQSSALTQGMAVGTPRNMAPEQVMATDQQDHRLDVWALGTVLYELLTGEAPFDAPSLQAVFAKVLVGQPTDLAELRPDLPPALVAVVRRCLIKDPDARLASVTELAQALLPFASTEGRLVGERAVRVGPPTAEADARTSGPLAGPLVLPAAPSAGAASADVTAATIAAGVGMRTTTAATRRLPRAGLRTLVGVLVALAAALAVALLVRGRGGRARPRPPALPLGAACEQDRECRPRACLRGQCTLRCQVDADCELPSTCLGGTCTLPLQVGFLHYGVPEDDGWTRAHEDARREVMQRLPWLRTDLVTDTASLDDAERGIERLIAGGAQVVVATSSSHLPAVRAKLAQHPEVTFIAVATGPAEAGIGMIDSRVEDAYFLAGIAAARATRSKRLGFVGPHLHAQPIRFINAFLHGAHRVDPSIELEVRWLGSWFDDGPADADGRHLEERLTQQLLAAGCDVIAHNVDSARVVLELEREAAAGRPVFAIANNTVEQCQAAPRACLGTTTRHWTPIYARVFDEIHRRRFATGQLELEGIRVDPDQSAVAFVESPALVPPETMGEIGRALAELDRGTSLFTGPFCWSGAPRDCVAAGVALADDRRWAMCRYLAGVVEPTAPDDPRSPRRPAQVPSSCGR